MAIQTIQKMLQVSTSIADAKVALLRAIPSLESGFNINSIHCDMAVTGEDAKAVMDFLAKRLQARVQKKQVGSDISLGKQFAVANDAVDVKSMPDPDAFRVLAYLSREACVSLDQGEGTRSGLYIRRVDDTLKLRGIVPMELDDIDLKAGVVYPSPTRDSVQPPAPAPKTIHRKP